MNARSGNMSRDSKNRWRKNLITQREQIQHDLLCILNGLDQSILDNVCQVVVDRFNILLQEV